MTESKSCLRNGDGVLGEKNDISNTHVLVAHLPVLRGANGLRWKRIDDYYRCHLGGI